MRWRGGRPTSSAVSMPTSRCCYAEPCTMPGECRGRRDHCRNGAGPRAIVRWRKGTRAKLNVSPQGPSREVARAPVDRGAGELRLLKTHPRSVNSPSTYPAARDSEHSLWLTGHMCSQIVTEAANENRLALYPAEAQCLRSRRQDAPRSVARPLRRKHCQESDEVSDARAGDVGAVGDSPNQRPSSRMESLGFSLGVSTESVSSLEEDIVRQLQAGRVVCPSSSSEEGRK